MPKFNDYWSTEAELRFVDGLGTWKDSDSSKTLTRQERIEKLQQYIFAHQTSPYDHHQQGVIYAKRIIAGLRGFLNRSAK